MVAQCLKKSPAALLPQDTRDSEGRERFHPFAPAQHLNYRIPRNPDWCARGPLPQQLSGSLSLSRDDVLLSQRDHTPRSRRYAQYSIDLKVGYDCCSPQSVSFHYVDAPLMRRIDALLHECRR